MARGHGSESDISGGGPSNLKDSDNDGVLPPNTRCPTGRPKKCRICQVNEVERANVRSQKCTRAAL